MKHFKTAHYYDKPVPKYGAFAVIFDEHGRVLMNHRTDKDFWDLPGGGVEYGEAPWQAAVRETKEETGLEVVIERLSGVYYFAESHELIFTFICKAVGGTLGNSTEAREHKYFADSEIPENTVHWHKQRIKDAVESKTAVLRKQSRDEI